MELFENKAQEEAINSIYGPNLIVSCPGSGKTTTLIRRIHHILEQGIDPRRILMITFTNAAAKEMKSRYQELYGQNPGVWFSTIHSLCFTILQREGFYGRDDLYLQEDARGALFGILKNKYHLGDAWDVAGAVLTDISIAKNNYSDPADMDPKSCRREIFLDLYKAYEDARKEAGKIDFDDMLLVCRNLFLQRPDLMARYQEQFQFIQVDEAQDTNNLQQEIIFRLAAKHGNLCLVGDDDQSIYRFRGAVPANFLSFQKVYPNTRKIIMGINYRSARTIVDVSNNLILRNKERYEKEFRSWRGEKGEDGTYRLYQYQTNREQLSSILSEIRELEKQGVPYSEMAILFRTNKQALLPSSMLMKEKIPFRQLDKVQSIYDTWLFRDIKSYAQLSAGTGNQKDLLRVLNHPNRWLKERYFRDVAFNSNEMIGALDYLNDGIEPEWKYEAASNKIERWMEHLGPGKVTEDDAPEKLFAALIGNRGIHYDKHIVDYATFRDTDADEYNELLDELRSEAGKFKTIREWFAYAERVSKTLRNKDLQNEDGVTVSTIHKAKGLEWKVVFVIECNRGVLPYKKSSTTPEDVEEERRLLYVAMTRAKDKLFIYTKKDEESRFITELKKPQAGIQRADAPSVPKYRTGTRLIHKQFGEGALIKYEIDRVVVQFGDEQKKFKHPDVFVKGLLKKVVA